MDKKMKIALTCPASIPAVQFGGILFLCTDIAEQLGKRKYDVSIFTTDLDFANNTNTFNKNLLKEENLEFFKIKRSHVFFNLKLFFINPGMYKLLKNEKPDLIHAIGIRGFQAFISAMVSKFNHIPLIISDQGGLFTHPDFNKGVINKILYRLQEPMIKFIIKQADKIIVANEYEKSIFEKYTDEEKLCIIFNGINYEKLLKSPFDFKKKYNIDKKFILFLGRFNSVKGIDFLLKSYSQITSNPNFQNLVLVIMGADFGYQNEMEKLILKLNLKDKIILLKKPAREDVIAAYHGCEFLVLPSRWEMSPLTPVEGFACKKPTISSKLHGIPYVIEDGVTGLLVNPENTSELTGAIIKLLESPDLTAEMGRNGYKQVEEIFNSKHMTKKILEVYKSVINL
jgi:glycosyltransferase involved in cell wall biosynthesis